MIPNYSLIKKCAKGRFDEKVFQKTDHINRGIKKYRMDRLCKEHKKSRLIQPAFEVKCTMIN